MKPQPQVLYIDDAASNLFLVELIAQDHNIDLETAENGLEGIEKVKAKEYTLILSDIRLPDVSGYEILKQTRADSLNVFTPVIAFTADVTVATREKILEHGFTDYLTKPFNADDLVKRFSVYLAQAVLTPDLSYYTTYIKDDSQLLKAKKMILIDFQDFEKKFCKAWMQRDEQEMKDQLHKIEFVCENLKLASLLDSIKEFKANTESMAVRELAVMKIKRDLLLLYKNMS
ncbi:MAG: two-component system response regulator [Cyclobacteriaceae bacterium]